MKRLLNIAKTSAFMGLKSGLKLANDTILEPADAWVLIQKEDALALDVRSDMEVAEGMLPNALHIPHTEIDKRAGEITVGKEHPIVVYCAVGGRASVTKADLEQLGFSAVFNAGSYNELAAHGREIGSMP